MWFFSDPLFAYLKDRGAWQKIGDMLIMIAVFTWIAGIYLISTNWPSFKQVFLTQSLDMKGLVQLDKNINEILTHTMDDISADRASLSRFHDSVADLQNRHFVYESRSNEVVEPGVSLVSQLRQNLLLSMINIWAQSFVKNECVYMTNILPTDQFYEFYRQTGTKSDIKCPVYNVQNVLVGYISMEFTTRQVSLEDMKSKEAMIRDTASKIGAVLSLRNE